MGLANLKIVNKSLGIKVRIEINYEDLSIIKRNIEEFNNKHNKEYIKILDTKFSEKVKIYVFLSYDKFKSLDDFKTDIIKGVVLEDFEELEEGIK